MVHDIQIPIPSEPWKKLAIDITGPFAIAPQSQRYVVVIIDYYSKFPEVLLTNDISSKRLTEGLDETFSRFGNPDAIVSYNGPNFVSHEFTGFLQSRDIEHIRVPNYDPRPNGLVEVFNRYLKYGAQTVESQSIS